MAAIALAAPFACTGSAGATTFCVPGFSASCPNSGGNVAEADVEKAMFVDSEDGAADTVRIAPGTFTETGSFEPNPGTSSPDTFEPWGSDPLTVIGAGAAATILTTAGSGNTFVANLDFNNNRDILIRDLTIEIPASFPDGLGAAVQMRGDTLEDVDLVSLNKESDGIASAVEGGNVFRGGEVRGEAGGSIGDALKAAYPEDSLLVEDATIRDAAWALVASEPKAHLIAHRVRVIGARNYGAIALKGSISIENSTMTIDDGIGLYAESSSSPVSVDADHVSISNVGTTHPAIEVLKKGGSAGVDMFVSNSVLRGFVAGYLVDATFGPGIGGASLGVEYSNLPAGTNNNGTLVATANIDADSKFAADLSLPPGSPSIDTGDPADGGQATDLLGAPRPVDGDGDGVARRDQGAFEYQPPAKPGGGGGGGGGAKGQTPPADTTPPETRIGKELGKKLADGKARLSISSSEAGSGFECKLDKRKPAPCASPKRYSHLKPGRHSFRAWAIDLAGNKDPTPAKRRFSVPGA